MKKNSRKIRATLLRLLKRKKGGHLGGSMSIVETLSTLYTKHMHFNPSKPDDPDRDYLVLSKGHAGPGLYSALSVFGFFPEEDISTMNEGGSRFPSHPDRLKTPGVDATTGSLGQGISVAAGLGMALRLE
ncbi:MAG: transketolase, partial [Fretibacterium sp.]|nr:transketolase [Fretibacterium sp.]